MTTLEIPRDSQEEPIVSGHHNDGAQGSLPMEGVDAVTPYEQFVGHDRTDGTFKSGEELRSQYVTLTDELIRKMTEGVSFQDPNTGERKVERPDVVVWLDKSARPVSWLTRELWPTLAPSAEEEPPEMPKFRFVNIDREQWVNEVDPNGIGMMDIDRVDDSVVRSLRSIFVKPTKKQEGLTPDIDEAEAELDHQRVLIVDEVFSTGRTLDIATQFFKKAFPTAKVEGAYWMQGVAVKNGAVGNADLPVWYKEDDVQGRGVGNRDERASKESKSITQRLGAWFLSTRLGVDPMAKQIRAEIKRLGQEAADGKMLVVPSMDRDPYDYDERAVRLNGMSSMDEYIDTKRSKSPKPKERPLLG